MYKRQDVLQGKFVSKDDEYKRFCRIDILEEDSNNIFHRMNNFTTRLQNEEFKKQIDDIIEVGLKRYHDKYQSSLKNESPFVLYEKYSRRDVSLLMNCGRDLSDVYKRQGEMVIWNRVKLKKGVHLQPKS